MTESVLHKNVQECANKKRHINIISIRSPAKPEIEFDKHYCHFVPPKEIVYDLNYIQMTDNDLSNVYPLLAKHDILNEGCNELLVYYEKDSGLGDVLLGILNLFQSSKLKKTVYLADEEDELGVNLEYNKFFQSYRFVLFLTKPESILHTITEQTSSGIKQIVTKTVASNLKLTCQPWFRKFVSRIFLCGVKRLLQTSGTCYLNSVINGIVLSPVLRNFFLNKMKEYVAINPESKGYISSPLVASEMTNCKRFAGKYTEEVQFLYKLLYNLSCKDIRPFPRVKYSSRDDIFIEASKEYFSTKVSGQGGFGYAAIFSFLYGSGANFLIAVENETNNLIYCKPNEILVNMPPFVTKFAFYDQYYNLLLADSIFFIPPDTEIILYIPRMRWLNDSTILDIHSEGYVAQSSSIYMTYEQYGITSGHAVAGFFCDRVPKIYDSGANIIFEGNWLGNASDFSDTYIANHKEIDPLRVISNIGIEYVLFTSSSIPHVSDVCFPPEVAKDVKKEFSWDVPLYRLYRENEFTPYFFSLLKNKIPISPDFFDLHKSSMAHIVNSKYKIIKMILDAYPQVQFSKYPPAAIIILKGRQFSPAELESSKLIIDDINVLYDIDKDLPLSGVPFELTNEVIEEAIADGQLRILNALSVTPNFTTEFMMKPSIIEHWDEIYKSYPSLSWSQYEGLFLAKNFRNLKNKRITFQDFQRFASNRTTVPYRILRYFPELWPKLKPILYNVDWQDVETSWQTDFFNITFEM